MNKDLITFIVLFLLAIFGLFGLYCFGLCMKPVMETLSR